MQTNMIPQNNKTGKESMRRKKREKKNLTRFTDLVWFENENTIKWLD